jgi:hypothetical protein|tara:strand:- start:371 stop:721 length:351 start_codon:yes stop_codon:yes gene_type:complete
MLDELEIIRNCEGKKLTLEEIENKFMDYNFSDTGCTKEEFRAKLKDKKFRESLRMPFGNCNSSWIKLRAKMQDGDWFETYDMGSWGDLCACAGIRLLRKDNMGKTIVVDDMDLIIS